MTNRAPIRNLGNTKRLATRPDAQNIELTRLLLDMPIRGESITVARRLA